MKKISLCFIALLAALMLFSCNSTPSSHTVQGEVTQEKINDALEHIFEDYRPSLDMTGAQKYTVVSGDTLVEITQRFYSNLTGVGEAGHGNGFYFPVIMLASEVEIVDPDLIQPGMVLTIPDLKRNLDNRSAHQAIKNCLKEVADIYSKKGNSEKQTGLTKLSNSI